MRKEKLITGEYYHVYNRGVDLRDIFLDEGDYERFLRSMVEFNNNSTYRNRDYFLRKKAGDVKELSSRYRELSSFSSFVDSLPNLVEIICYCLNQNHYHLLLKQLADNGIEKFMHKLGSGYTNFFNVKYERSGSLFQGPFKAIEIDSNEDLLWLSAYVNDNAQIHGLVQDASKYKWCSYPEYLGLNANNFCHKDIIIEQFRDNERFKSFMNDCVKTMKEKKELQKYLIE